jgi:16S rRNA (guanine(966)-N(2))-methyltransferase RsmD
MRLSAPRGQDVRPTSDRVREAVFSILGDRVDGARFLDLYAGAGGNGLEALSRGAESCVFVERDPKVLAVARANAERCRLAGRARFVAAALPTGLKRLEGQAFDLVFADPPYAATDVEALLDAVCALGLLADAGLVAVEHARRYEGPASAGILTHQRTATYGDTGVSFFA